MGGAVPQPPTTQDNMMTLIVAMFSLMVYLALAVSVYHWINGGNDW